MKRSVIHGVTALSFLFCAVLSSTAFSAPSAEVKEASEAEAIQVAENWLKLIDSKKYEQSWKESAEIFRAALPKSDDWSKMAEKARAPFGDLISRKKIAHQVQKSLPGVPDGKYVIIQFHSKFKNKNEVIETVTPSLEKDGKFRVSGYYLK